MNGKIHIGFLLYPGLMQLDLTGAYGVLSAGSGVEIDLIWKDLRPVKSVENLSLKPTRDFGYCPPLDVLCVPGGSGLLPLLTDGEVHIFLREQAKKARFVTSVCTGALILGAAGLLKGYKATTHWRSYALLEKLGAIPTEGRVVEDGNRITSAGVTSGIDMGFVLAAKLWGEKVAQEIQLNMEYAPEPPFNAGTPKTAPKEVLESLNAKSASNQQKRMDVIEIAAKLLGL